MLEVNSIVDDRQSMYSGLPTGMVVDPDIHLKGWTRAQAIAYTGVPLQEVEQHVLAWIQQAAPTPAAATR